MAIPQGIQVLLKKAAVDPDFRELLLTRRAGAADEIELTLHDNEIAVLGDVPETHLAMMIDQTVVAPDERPVFLGKAVIPMLAVIGVATGGCTMGHRIDRPPVPRHEEPSQQDIEEVAPTSDSETVKPQAEPKPPSPVSKGARPDRPEMKR